VQSNPRKEALHFLQQSLHYSWLCRPVWGLGRRKNQTSEMNARIANVSKELQNVQDKLAGEVGVGRVSVCESLARHCNWKVGGPADIFFKAETVAELKAALRVARGHDCPTTLLGFGANVLVSDEGIRGLVILNRADRLIFHSDFIVEVDSGTNLAVLARQAAKYGIGGLEFLIGIPGTVGGAVYGNAGTGSKWISHVMHKTRLFTTDCSECIAANSDMDFRYRSSRLKRTGEVVLTAWLRGSQDDPANVEKELQNQLELRENQPGGPSTGSVFMNPAGDHAGRMIEAAGLKGRRVGGAKISEMHANFILNSGGATAADIRELILLIQSTVEGKFGVRLQEEIRYIGEFS
jgi:UDP-N-acetylmuramate dehydrogenase